MTARRKRPTRPAPPGRPHVRATMPSQAARLRRGPTPPDGVIAALHAAIAADLAGTRADATTDAKLALGRRWKTAIVKAARAIANWARRGVARATGAAADTVPLGVVPADWITEITAAVTASILREGARNIAEMLAAANGVAAEHVLREHARQVQNIAVAMGSEEYLWTTMLDSKVRVLHAKLEGTRQRWDDPPLAGLPDFHANPGGAKGCRCMPWPIGPAPAKSPQG